MQKELVMIFDGNIWQDIYYRDGTLDGSVVTESDALDYVKKVYGSRFPNCQLTVENNELYALVPDNVSLPTINNV